MHFIRKYTSGAKYDPRSKTWAEFYCAVCGENSDIDITARENTFDFARERLCPHCNQKSPEDALQKTQIEIDLLTQERSRIDIQIEKLVQKLEQFSSVTVENK